MSLCLSCVRDAPHDLADPGPRFNRSADARRAPARRVVESPAMDLSFNALLVALGIFGLRIGDVSIGTVRTIFTIRGYRLISFCLGVVESGIWIFAISRVMKYISH